MYCKYCGKLNDEDALFCKECGMPFNIEEQRNKEQDNSQNKTKTKNKTKNKIKNKTKHKTKNKTKKEKPRKTNYQKTEKGMTFGQKILMFLLFIMVIGLTGIVALAGYKYYNMEQVKVPNLINMTYEQAELTLAKKDLKIKKIEEETNNQSKDNIVLKQNKQTGTKIRKNSTIKVYIGKYEQTYITENYIGENINEVMNVLDNNNIKYEIKYKETNDYDNYTVISQTPKKGKKLTTNDTIELTVAKNNKKESTPENETNNKDEIPTTDENVETEEQKIA